MIAPEGERSLRSLTLDLIAFARASVRTSVAKNALALYVIQFGQYLFPLITVPYLMRVLTPSGYGVVAFGRSFVMMFVVLIEYGFAFSATRKIAIGRDNGPGAVSQTSIRVWTAKFLIFCLGFLVLLVLTKTVPKLREVAALLLILYGIALGNVLFPVWLFQGMEQMIYISIINLTVNFLTVIGTFVFVRQQSDYLRYAALLSISSIVSGAVGVAAAMYAFELRFKMPSWAGVKETFTEGWSLFLSQASVSLYTTANSFLLGLLSTHAIVGYYAAAERIVSAVVGMFGPLTQAIYPRLSKIAAVSRERALHLSRWLFFGIELLGALVSLMLFVFAPWIVRLLMGGAYLPSIRILRLLSALPFIICGSNVLGIQTMLPFGKDKMFALIIFAAGVLNVALAYPFVAWWKGAGMAMAVLASEAFVTLTMLAYLESQSLGPLKLMTSRSPETSALPLAD